MNVTLQTEQQIPDGFFDCPLPVIRVLYEAEQPVVYVTKTRQGQEMLAYLASEDAPHQFTVVSPITPQSLNRLESGSISIREALTDSWMWLVKQSIQDGKVEVWSVSENDIPEGYLPKAGTPLLPDQRIAFSARAIGEGIALGHVPCSVISYVADAARSSLKTLLDYVMDAKGEGRPTDAHRALYDLPVRQMRFASFEVGLSAPSGDLYARESINQALKHLQAGLDWAVAESAEHDLKAEDTEAILRATLSLTPPGTGVITAIEVGGSWLGGRRYHLSREARTKVSKTLRKLQSEKIVVYEGRIGEIDDDKLSFILRDVSAISEGECRGTFPEELLDDMRTHYYDSDLIEISGVIRNGKLRVTAVIDKTEASN